MKIFTYFSLLNRKKVRRRKFILKTVIDSKCDNTNNDLLQID